MTVEIITCKSWVDLLQEVMRVMTEFEWQRSPSALPFFRGHSSTAYQLLPGLFRPVEHRLYEDYDEKNFYYEFRARAGVLLDPSYSSWDILFLMQHHRVPTRLLDWTESFATALYFALEGAEDSVDVWMLDPYMLNQRVIDSEAILDVDTGIQQEYFDLFFQPAGERPRPDWTVVAVYPRRQIARLASQHGLFTLHFVRRPLEELEAQALTCFRLIGGAVEEARRFLRVMGVNDLSLFPDLDGLSRFLRKRIKGGYGIVP